MPATERRATAPSNPRAAAPSPTDEFAGDGATRRTARPSAGRPHRARAGELAALAFTTPLPIPAQRGPSED